MSKRIVLSRKGNHQSFLKTWNDTNDLKYWHRTHSKGGQLVEGKKLWHLADQGTRLTEDDRQKIEVYDCDIWLNFSWTNVTTHWQHWLNWKIADPNPRREWPIWNQWIYPIPDTNARGVLCSRATAAQTTFIVSFPIPPTIWMSTPFLFYELEGDNRCSI